MKTLSSKVIFYISITVIGIHVLYNSYYLYDLHNELDKRFAESIEIIEENFTQNITIPLYEFNELNIDKVLEITIKFNEVSAIVLKDGENNYITKRDPDLEINVNPYTGDLTKKHKYIETGDLYYRNAYIGTYHIVFTKDGINKMFNREVKTSIFLFLIIISLVILVLSLLLRKTVIAPITKLASSFEKISEGNFDVKAVVNSKDEIGLLAKSFNSMNSRLKESFEKQNELLQQLKENNVKLNNEISERKLSQLELSKTKNFLNTVFDSLNAALISVDSDLKVTNWNKPSEQYFSDDTVITYDKIITDVIPITNQFKDKIVDVIETNNVHAFKLDIKNGSTGLNYFNVSIVPLIFESVTGAVIRIDNITELEKKEDQLRQAQKMEIVGNLAGGIAHDFNNVLGGIVGNISLLEFSMEMGELDKDDLQDKINIIKQASSRATDMVKHLLTLSRKQELSLMPVDLNLSIKHIVKFSRNTLDKSIDIEASYYNKGEALIMGNPTHIEQVLLNMCINAAHSMTIMRKEGEQAGGIIRIGVSSFYVDEHILKHHPGVKEGNYWLIKVKDTGVGIEPEALKRIFDPFFTTKENNKGSGLGLTMSYNIIKQLNGFIEVYSELGVGTTFSIFIPQLKKDVAVDSAAKSMKLIKGSGTILLVDDEEIIRSTVSGMLKSLGYDVIIAEDGEIGVEKFKEHHEKIDLVLLDMVMPNMSGKEAYIEMKKIKPDLKVLMSSGFIQDSRIQDSISLGISGFIQKPFPMNELGKKINEILKG